HGAGGGPGGVGRVVLGAYLRVGDVLGAVDRCGVDAAPLAVVPPVRGDPPTVERQGQLVPGNQRRRHITPATVGLTIHHDVEPEPRPVPVVPGHHARIGILH